MKTPPTHLIGKRGRLTSNEGWILLVGIKDARRAYGRDEVQVECLGQLMWVQADRVKVEEGK